MDSITLENYRCFRDKQTARLAPITLLVGENSTGKTSFLALIRALQDIEFEGIIPNFKKEPYDLGSFDEIAHHRGRGGRARTFQAGFDLSIQDARRRRKLETVRTHYEVTFKSKGTAPFPRRRRLEFEKEVWFEEKGETKSSEERSLYFGTRNGVWKFPEPARNLRTSPYGHRIEPMNTIMSFAFFRSRRQMERSESPKFEIVEGASQPSDEDIKLLESYSNSPMRSRRRYSQRVLASAPVRFKPFRTYDPYPVERDPEGLYVPYYLAEMQDEENWPSLQGALEEFGRTSGLFDEISIKRLGRGGSDPFQIQIKKYGSKATKVKGPNRNLIDVGYGVSQVLPVITELFTIKPPIMFLIQQPEVHLHPRAQASLGSLFCQIAGSGRQLVIETHSDYIIDRIRMEVRDRATSLKPDDISILYFESGNLDVKIYSLKFDSEGNFIEVPDSYRQFFMEETRKLLKL